MAINIGAANISKVRMAEQGSNPPPPAAGFRFLFVKNNGVYEENSAGAVTGPLGAGYSDEQAQDAVGTILLDSATVDLTYDDAAPSITAAVITDSIGNNLLANMATDTVKGRATAGSGDPEDLTALPFAFTGDVTRPADSNAQTIANDAVTYAQMQNVSAASKLLGRGSAAGAGDVEEITLGSGLTMSGTTLDASGGGAGGHLHGLSRWVGDGAATTFDLLDIAEYLDVVSQNGDVKDPILYSLSADRVQLVFDVAPTAGHVLTANYVVAQI